jgi:hypothetical protein
MLTNILLEGVSIKIDQFLKSLLTFGSSTIGRDCGVMKKLVIRNLNVEKSGFSKFIYSEK